MLLCCYLLISLTPCTGTRLHITTVDCLLNACLDFANSRNGRKFSRRSRKVLALTRWKCIIGTNMRRRCSPSFISIRYPHINSMFADNFQGGKVVLSYYNKGIPAALVSLFPDIGLDTSILSSNGAYLSASTLRKFFDNYAHEKGFDPLQPDNWYSMRHRDISGRKVPPPPPHINSLPTLSAPFVTIIAGL